MGPPGPLFLLFYLLFLEKILFLYKKGPWGPKKRGLQKNNLHLNCCLRENHSFSQISENNLRDIHGELDILAVEVLEAEDVFVQSFASL